jgi:hypothetical protein
MAGGTGGTGGSPNGVSGLPGAVEPQGTNVPAIGGHGGVSEFRVIDGGTTYGPHGTGGGGASILNYLEWYTITTYSSGAQTITPDYGITTYQPSDGNPGALIISWGGGNSGQIYSTNS